MSDVRGTSPEEPVVPEGVVAPEGAVVPEDAVVPEEPVITPAAEVIPPPPPDIPIPDGLLAPPPEIPPADVVIPPSSPATRRGSDRPRPTPAILTVAPPAAVADDWAKPSVAPEVPTSGGYRAFTVVIFAFLFLLLVAAIVTGVYLLNTTGLPFADVDGAAVDSIAFAM